MALAALAQVSSWYLRGCAVYLLAFFNSTDLQTDNECARVDHGLTRNSPLLCHCPGRSSGIAYIALP